MPYISDYKIEEHEYTKGEQRNEAYINGYRIKLSYSGKDYFSEPIDNLDEAIEHLEWLKKSDGV